ncbi:hypothetical protein [Cupriavidus necator]|uniref:hypothetical protein n=1 Tax=Cupriavidus necator TaxID=106590 RepID=UPI00115FD72C|nr:hypothetical protein [Cupriavidus necator]
MTKYESRGRDGRTAAGLEPDSDGTKAGTRRARTQYYRSQAASVQKVWSTGQSDISEISAVFLMALALLA